MFKRILTLALILCSHVLYASALPIPAPPKLNASSWVLLDAGSQQVLVAHNADKRIEPASITKVMTSYVVYDALKQGLISLDDEVIISEKAWRMKGSRMFIEVDKRVNLHDLIKGMVIQSGNDSAVALAEHVAGSEEAFAARMNEMAARLGMANTHFVNATGWPNADHYTTANDIAKLSRALINDFPNHYAEYATKEFEYNGIKQPNRNRLLWKDSSIDGIKTGHTEAAGYCLAASAKRNGMRLISVVMGTESDKERARYSETLLNYGFRYYESHTLYKAGVPLRNIKVWKGAEDAVGIAPLQDISVTIQRGQYAKLKPSLQNIVTPLVAPVQRGQSVAEIHVKLGDELIAQAPAVAVSAVKKGSIFSRAADAIMLMFE